VPPKVYKESKKLTEQAQQDMYGRGIRGWKICKKAAEYKNLGGRIKKRRVKRLKKAHLTGVG